MDKGQATFTTFITEVKQKSEGSPQKTNCLPNLKNTRLNWQKGTTTKSLQKRLEFKFKHFKEGFERRFSNNVILSVNLMFDYKHIRH